MEKKTERLFTNEQLVKLIIPLVIEQFLAYLVGMADTIMVASVGEMAVSGISLVDNVFLLLLNFFGALATGGAVVAGHYIGQKKIEKACESADQLLLTIIMVSAVITGFVYLGRDFILTKVFGDIEPIVYKNAKTYLMITAASIPFLAIYNGGAALFRAEGNSKVSMIGSLIMNGLNITGNAILIYGLKLGVEGAAIPTLFSRMVAAIMIVMMLRNQKLRLHISKVPVLKLNGHMVKKILHIGIPNGLESSIFQLGKILVLSLVASFGTASIAANAISNTVACFQVLAPSAINMAILTVISQCIGAGDNEQVRYYIKKLFAIMYSCNFVINIVIFFALPTVLKFYHLSPETYALAKQIVIYHGCMAVFFWPLSFSLPNVLRAANDVKFTMWVAISTMWLCRVGLSYVIGRYMGLGVFGVWMAMTIDWIVRGIIFSCRYFSGKWNKYALEK